MSPYGSSRVQSSQSVIPQLYTSEASVKQPSKVSGAAQRKVPPLARTDVACEVSLRCLASPKSLTLACQLADTSTFIDLRSRCWMTGTWL